MLYDLGSCRGTFAIGIQNQLPGLKVVGIDNSLFRTLLARVRSLFSRPRPIFLHGDLFNLDLSDADVINVYLPEEMLPKALDTISSLKRKVIVSMYRLAFVGVEPTTRMTLANSKQRVSIYTFS